MIISNNQQSINDNIKLFLFELDIYGTINIKIEFIKPLQLNNIEDIIKNNINPIFDIIKKYINNDFNNISYFDSLFDTNVEIINLNYFVNIDSIIDIKSLNNINNCLYLLFNIISDKSKEKIYRYKRVSNYNEMNDKEAFIIELIKQKETPIKIIQLLKENFKIPSFEESTQLFETTIQSLNLVQSIFNYRKLKIKNSPGFLFKIDNNVIGSINISINNIDNIRYIHFIKIYIDTIFKLAFNKNYQNTISFCNSNRKPTSKINKPFTDDYIPDEIKLDLTQKNIDNVLNTDIELDIDEIIDSSSSIDDDDDDDDDDNNLLDILLDNDSEMIILKRRRRTRQKTRRNKKRRTRRRREKKRENKKNKKRRRRRRTRRQEEQEEEREKKKMKIKKN